MKLRTLSEEVIRKKVKLILQEAVRLSEEKEQDYSRLGSYFVIHPDGTAKFYDHHGDAVFENDEALKMAMNVFSNDKLSIRRASARGSDDLYSVMYKLGFIRCGRGGGEFDAVPWFSFSPKYVKFKSFMTILGYMKFRKKDRLFVEEMDEDGYHDSDEEYTIEEFVERFM